MSTVQGQAQTGRSNFVTVLAWIFIVVAGFSTFISVLQNIMVQLMFSTPEMQRAIAESSRDKNVPWFAQFMFDHFRWFFAAMFVLSASTFASAIGLLKRMNWARQVFIAILALGIVWNIGGFALQLSMFSSMTQSASDVPAEFQARFETMFLVIALIGGTMAIAMSVLFGWIIKRLMSASVKREFNAES